MKSFIELFNDYDKFDRVTQSGEVMLVDLSCEYDYYKTDLANGSDPVRFSRFLDVGCVAGVGVCVAHFGWLFLVHGRRARLPRRVPPTGFGEYARRAAPWGWVPDDYRTRMSSTDDGRQAE
jgi:hypothetical protein